MFIHRFFLSLLRAPRMACGAGQTEWVPVHKTDKTFSLIAILEPFTDFDAFIHVHAFIVSFDWIQMPSSISNHIRGGQRWPFVPIHFGTFTRNVSYASCHGHCHIQTTGRFASIAIIIKPFPCQILKFSVYYKTKRMIRTKFTNNKRLKRWKETAKKKNKKWILYRIVF